MRSLVAHFGLPVVLAFAIAVATMLAAVAHSRRTGRGLHATARVWLVGSIGVILAGTGLPRDFPEVEEKRRRLALAFGSGGLGNARVLVDDPTSLEALLLLLNVAMYVPLGLALFWMWPRRGPIVLGIALAVAVGIESLQYLVLGREASTDDVVLNVTGAVIGWIIAKLAHAVALRRRGRVSAPS